MQVDSAQPARYAVELRIVPGDGESDGRVEEHAEIVCVVGVFPEIVGINNEPLSDALLEPSIVLVPIAGLEGLGDRSENVLGQSAASSAARKDEVLIVGCFKAPRIGRAQNGVGA